MPVWLRKYTFKSIQEFYEKQAEAQEEQMNRVQGIQKATSQNTIQMPDAVKKATYTTKKQ